MLMLYLFKAEVFDLGLNYSSSTDTVVIADSHEDRGRLLQQQFGEHDGRVVRRSVLLAARALTLTEIRLLESFTRIRTAAWLVTRLSSMDSGPYVRPLPRLLDESNMLELLERFPERYDSTALMRDQYVHSTWFSKLGSEVDPLRVAA